MIEMTEIETKNNKNLGRIKISINLDKCTGCGLCGEVCPFGLPQQGSNKKFQIKNPHLCTECSACQRNCPTQAVELEEKIGCGCLWDARQRSKNKKKGIVGAVSCCGAPLTPLKVSCCDDPSTQIKLPQGPISILNQNFQGPMISLDNNSSCCRVNNHP